MVLGTECGGWPLSSLSLSLPRVTPCAVLVAQTMMLIDTGKGGYYPQVPPTCTLLTRCVPTCFGGQTLWSKQCGEVYLGRPTLCKSRAERRSVQGLDGLERICRREFASFVFCVSNASNPTHFQPRSLASSQVIHAWIRQWRWVRAPHLNKPLARDKQRDKTRPETVCKATYY